MGTEVQCSCGQRFLAKPELIGQQVRCSSCGSMFVAKPTAAAPANNPAPAQWSSSVQTPRQSQPSFQTSRPQPRKTANSIWTRFRILIVLGGSSVILLVIGWKLLAPAVTAAIKRSGAGVSSSTGIAKEKTWQQLVVQDGNYRVDFPGTQQTVSTTEETMYGPVLFRGTTSDFPEGAFRVVYADLDPSARQNAPQSSLAIVPILNVRFGGMASVNGVVANGLSGIAATGTGNIKKRKLVYRLRNFVVGDRLYELLWVGNPCPEADVERFFNSFQLISAVGDQGTIVSAQQLPEDKRKQIYVAFVKAMQTSDHEAFTKGQIIKEFNLHTIPEIDAIIAEGKSKGW